MIDPTQPRVLPPLALWGGVECTVNRVGDRYHDQLELTGHAGRTSDLERIASLGIRTVRYPVLWERVAPAGLEHADWRWSDGRLAALRALGLRPIAGLVHHGSGPPYATLLDGSFPEALAAYADAVARRYPWIEAYTPVNEPTTTARFCGLYGHWYPHRADDAAFVRALIHECLGTALAMRAIRRVNPSALLVQTDDTGVTYSTPRLRYQADFENERRWLAWDLIAGRVTREHPLRNYLRRAGAAERELEWFVDHPCRIDVIGLNYYVTSDRFLDDDVAKYPAGAVGGNGRHRYADVEAVRGRGVVAGHYTLISNAWARYRTPVAITEAHLGCSREEQLRWLMEAWEGAGRARRDGADVRAVTAWALFGLSDWDSLVTRTAGRYEPGAYDVRGPEPRPTALAAIVTDLARGRDPAHPALPGVGWWRRAAPERTTVRRLPAARPVLIAGAGTLGHAFARICETRGLAWAPLARRDMDIADEASVSAALQRLNPWAVVNAAGYVRVDDAERDEDRCIRSNATGPAVLARLCAQQGRRLVTFSSDLVFGGTATRPYVESDAVQPLSVYGRTKAEAERRVLEAHPDALVVRTSAFFGPWDRWNVLHLALSAIQAGRPWKAAADQRVSPTYVPDLVHAVLDLLIDGAGGIWHLANAGDVSWAEFVGAAASACGHAEGAVLPCETTDLHLAAPRPRYSVLGTERGGRLRPLEEAIAEFVTEWTSAAGTVDITSADEPRLKVS